MKNILTKTMKLFLSILLLLTVFNSTAQCSLLNFNKGPDNEFKVFASTGAREIDNILNLEKKYLEIIFQVTTELKILDDTGAPNACSTDTSSNPVRFDGTVYLGYTLLTSELQKRKNGLDAIRGIMAHEFAHILQDKLDCGLKGSFRERHADLMAGYYMGIQDIYKQTSSLETFAQSLFENGDGDLWNESHHGTPKKRVLAMCAGYALSKQDKTPQDAYYIGIDILNSPDDGSLKISSPTTTTNTAIVTSSPKSNNKTTHETIGIHNTNRILTESKLLGTWQITDKKSSEIFYLHLENDHKATDFDASSSQNIIRIWYQWYLRDNKIYVYKNNRLAYIITSLFFNEQRWDYKTSLNSDTFTANKIK